MSRRGLLAASAAVASQRIEGTAFAAAAPLTLTLTLTLTMNHPDGRATAYRALYPSRGGAWGLVLFSHGANSSFQDYDRFWRPWAEAGYLVVGPNHIDTGPPATQQKVSRSTLWQTRLADTALPLHRREPFDRFAADRNAKIDWTRVCAAGHSFGAVVAQALSGASLIAPGESTARSAPLTGVAACVALSPPGPLKDFIPNDAWTTVGVPSLLQTGDADILPGFVDDWRLRLTGFAGRPDRWTLLGHGVDHYFHGLICRLNPSSTGDSAALGEAADLTTQFLNAYLRGEEKAMAALQDRARVGDDGVATFRRG